MSSHSHQHAQPQQPAGKFQPFIADSKLMPEFTIKSILLGAMFGVIFGASTVYLALKAGLTVSASIPIAVLAISLGRKAFKTTILENNITLFDYTGDVMLSFICIVKSINCKS